MDADRAGGTQAGPPATENDEFIEIYLKLMSADDDGDITALARIGWGLLARASALQQSQAEALGRLEELVAAAAAAVAGAGSTASVALLEHVLARHGWLPPRDATPLQVVAAPAHLATPAEAPGLARPA